MNNRLVIVDLENLVGAKPDSCSEATFGTAVDQLVEAIGFTPETDRVVIGVNPTYAFVAHGAFPCARIVTRSGVDGADLRLCEELADVPFVARRFTTVVIASGDHIFIDPVMRLNHTPVETVIAARPRSLSARLRLAAQRVVWLPTPPTSDPVSRLEAA